MMKLLWALTIGILSGFAFLGDGALANSPEQLLPQDWQLGFMEPSSPVMERLDGFHDILLYVIYAITAFVMLLLIYVCIRFSRKNNPTPSTTSHNTTIEIVWTTVPVLILVALCIPSMKHLYYMQQTPEADMTIKVTGHQWYWEYEYPDHAGINFDSRIIWEKDENKPKNYVRLLDVDNRLVVPVGKVVRVLITASDVMHAWAIPPLAVKIDAIPGRTNETWFKANKPGVYYGQCSELCGVWHGFMPIAVEVVTEERFKEWVKEAEQKFGSVTKPADSILLASK